MNSEQALLEAEIDLGRYAEVLVRRWWLVASAVAAALIVALLASFVSAPVYQASITVMVDRSGFTAGFAADLTGVSQQAIVDTLAEIVKSRAVAERAMERLKVPREDREAVLNRLQAGLRVQRVRGADIIRISADGPTPQQAADTANAVGDAFLDWHVASQRSQAAAGREFIERQLAIVDGELHAAENSLASYKTIGDQVALSEQTTLAVTKGAEFEAQRRAAAAERQGVEASLNKARAELSRLAPTVPSAFVTSEDPVAGELRSELAKLEVDLATLREQLTARHPRVTAIEARIEEVKNALKQRAAQRLASETAGANPLYQDLAGRIIQLEVERDALRARETALTSVVNRYNRDARSLPPKEIKLARLTRDLKVAEDTFLLLSEKLQEARIAEASIVGELRIVDRAVPPATPIAPRTRLNAMLGALLGLMAGVGAVFVVESMDTTIKRPDEAAELVGLPVLSAIPSWREASRSAKDSIVPVGAQQRRSAFAESFRHLRTGLLYSNPDKPLRTILVTSPGSGEGKSTVAANLAVTLAAIDRRVWLVECDLRRPSLAWAFQPKTPFGLTDLLVDGLTLDQAVQRTAVENLWFLPGGTQPPNPAELLGSQKMRDFLRRDMNGTEMLVLDGPPVLAVTDSEVLAPAVDGVLLVVRIGITPRDAVRRAYLRLEAVGARVLGIVANGIPRKRREGYYGYYAYYDESEAGSRSEAPAAKS